MFAPSTSPENNFRFQGKNCSVSQTSTMTMSIIKDLFLNCIRAATILNEDTAFANDLAKTSETLLPFRIGSKGQLLEWYEEQEEAEPHHRHVSHLYALHPARLIECRKNTRLAQASRQTLELRGDERYRMEFKG
jgi:alpha-L-fucosidase 2